MPAESLPERVASTSRAIRLALAQFAVPTDASEARARVERAIAAAAAGRADLVALPELCLLPYFPVESATEAFDLAEPIPGPASDWLGEIASGVGVAINTTLFERIAAGVYANTSVLVDREGRLVATYRKAHIPDDPGFGEKYYFTPGDRACAVATLDTDAGPLRVGLLVCWDQWYPEAARLAALQGAELLLYPTAIGWAPDEAAEHAAQHDAWRTMHRGHAIANAVYVAAANRVGVERETTFWGGSCVVAPDGAVLGEMGHADDGVAVVDIDRAAIERQRRFWPFLRDRRIDLYGGLTRRWLGEPEP
ncbi:MAG: nitrilase-related carbon-nitrogen hydrolase [Planctomycetota bacterium]